MDGEAGWWTTSGNIGLPPLARAMGVGRQQQQPSRYNSLKLIKLMALTLHKQFSFSHRVIWNELPDSVVLSDNLNMFKRNLDLFWKDKDFKYEKNKTMSNVDNYT